MKLKCKFVLLTCQKRCCRKSISNGFDQCHSREVRRAATVGCQRTISGGLSSRGKSPTDYSKSRHHQPPLKITIQNLYSKKTFDFQIAFNIYVGSFLIQVLRFADLSKIRSVSIVVASLSYTGRYSVSFYLLFVLQFQWKR